MKILTEKEAWNKISAYCSSAERCKADVNQKLKGWGIDSETSFRIVDQLEKENYMDEARYCRSFVHDKYLLDKWGKRKIIQALHYKQIPDKMIAQSLESEIDREEYLAILEKLIENKKKSTKASSQYELNGKLVRFALSRGYEMEDVNLFVNL